MTAQSYPPAPYGRKGTGKLVVEAAWRLLRQDRDLMWLPALGALGGFVAFVLLIAPGALIGWSVGNASAGAWVGGVLGMLLASWVGMYCQAALVLGALQRADGGDPSLRSVLAQTWRYRKRILQYALLNSTVGVLVRVVEQRLGFVAALLAFLGGLAWAIATFFTVPVLIVEGVGPITAVKRSVAVIKQRWGVSVRSSLRVGIPYTVAAIAAVVTAGVGGALIAAGGAGMVVGGLLVAVGLLAAMGAGMLASALLSYARTLVYRHAVGMPVPGIAPELLDGVFLPRQR
jgi:hypothetical protein